MKIKVAEATERQLDWLVERIEIARMRAAGEHIKEWWVNEKQSNPSPYSTDPLLAWPIIDRERIGIEPSTSSCYGYMLGVVNKRISRTYLQSGTTHLIAAMRCWVAFNAGDEVEIPEELA